MGRTRREWERGAVLHIMNRGVHRSTLFLTRFDYQKFLRLMMEMTIRYDCEVLAYCLMSNHYHLLLRTAETPVWQCMKFLQMNYAIYFNRAKTATGHLFESRYLSYMITDESYLLTASRYIHLNPVSAGMVQNPAAYQYSSYRGYIEYENNILASSDLILSLFGSSHPERKYREFVEGPIIPAVIDEEILREMAKMEPLAGGLPGGQEPQKQRPASPSGEGLYGGQEPSKQPSADLSGGSLSGGQVPSLLLPSRSAAAGG